MKKLENLNGFKKVNSDDLKKINGGGMNSLTSMTDDYITTETGPYYGQCDSITRRDNHVWDVKSTGAVLCN